MVDLSETVVLAAIEDAALLVAEATYAWDEQQQQYDLPEIGQITHFPRVLPTPENGGHEQGDIETEGFIEDISDFAKGLNQVAAYGISTFGAVVSPAGLVRNAPPLGKQGAVSINFKTALQRLAGNNTRVPIYVENDASAAAMGEAIAGAGSGETDFAYLWVGRGVNIGMIREGEIFRTKLHPEAGHMPVNKHPEDPLKESSCSIHISSGDAKTDGCVTGFCSYLSLGIRKMPKAPEIDTVMRNIIASYLARVCVNATLFLAPSKIVVGGISVQDKGQLVGILPDIRAEFESLVRDYPRYRETIDLDDFIVPAERGEDASLIGMGEVVRRQLSRRRLEA